MPGGSRMMVGYQNFNGGTMIGIPAGKMYQLIHLLLLQRVR